MAKYGRFIKLIVLSYALVCGLFFAYQHLLYFQPKALDVNHALTFPVRLKFSAVKIPFDTETQIDVVKFQPDSHYVKPKGVVLFFHGNRFNVEHYSTYAPYFAKHGYEVWMPDYPGYGRSTGEINAGLLDDIALQVYTMARKQFEPDRIILYGKSLGTGIASRLASVRDCRHLILETPYYSLSSLTQSYAWFLPVDWLLRFDLKTGEYFREINAPITALVAGNDELIPIDNSLRLLPDMKPSDRFIIVKEAKHNNLPDFKEYHQTIDSLCR
ncbi:MAG: lysophospholipase [Chitinophagaceae bacterium]|nr:lysophospholipase [Chitinophagaceae bacterium]